MVTRHWISCHLFTVRVVTDSDDRIIEAAPIVRRFVGQPLANLLGWAAKRGGFIYAWEEEEESHDRPTEAR